MGEGGEKEKKGEVIRALRRKLAKGKATKAEKKKIYKRENEIRGKGGKGKERRNGEWV